MKQMGLDAERVEHAGELDRDISCADKGDLLGELLNVKETVAVGAELGPGD